MRSVYTVFIQLIDMSPEDGAIELLQLNARPFVKENCQVAITCLSGAQRHKFQSTGSGGAVERRRGSKLNELRLTYQPKCFAELPSTAKTTALDVCLTISPTCRMWCPTGVSTPGEAVSSRSSDLLTWFSREEFVRCNKLQRYPSVYAVTAFVGADDSFPREHLIEEFYNAMRTCQFSTAIRGSGDFGRRRPRPLITTALAKQPRGFALLDSRFDALHDVLIGSRESCTALHDEFPKLSTLRKLPDAADGSSLAFLELSPGVADDPAHAKRAQAWLIESA